MNHIPVAEFVPIYVEVKFQVPINEEVGDQLYCKGEKCRAKERSAPGYKLVDDIVESDNWRGLPVVYEGRIDVVVRDRHGDYWIVDWKKTQRMMNDDSDVILELDDQVTGYVWALRRQLGLNIRGFRYIELKKGFPEPPKELKVVRLGRSFSISQSQDTDSATFRRTVQQRDAGAYREGLYDEYLAWLDSEGPCFIQDHKVYKRPIQLDNFGVHLYETVKEMVNPDLALYPSPVPFSYRFSAYREIGRASCRERV